MNVRAAAVQTSPVFLDREATVEKACGFIDTAAAGGAGLIVFPETFVPAYPDWVWRSRPWDDGASDWYARLLDQSVVIPGPATDALGEAAAAAEAYVSIGVNERDGSTLYNTVVYVGPDSTLLGAHPSSCPPAASGSCGACRDDLYGGEDDWLARGNSAIVAPDGDILAGPLVEAEGIVYADIDVARAHLAHRQIDPIGHYARPDVFQLHVDTRPKPPVELTDQ
ncbi:MAG: nitrilase-related carbon-nitrogen hydrolase [Acidimicrobiales bacterium]